ncbi:MAG TPA: hypothetical protein VIM65_22210, partial [Cyclobacteriaceae bacterium]
PTYPVWIHIALQNLYHAVTQNEIEISSGDLYFKSYAFLQHTISLFLFPISVVCLFSIAKRIVTDKRLQAAIPFAYILYPSVCYYIGNLANYESIALSCVIIAFYFLFKGLSEKLSVAQIVLCSFVIVISTFIRPQLNIIYTILLISFAVVVFQKKYISFRRQFIYQVLLVGLLIISSSAFVFIKNYHTVGKYTLSTHGGIAFFEGHNPYARGSWCGDCDINPKHLRYQFVRNEIPGFDTLSEIQRSEALTVLAKSWIYQHPFQEVVLTCRKVAMFFLPYNSDSDVFNIFNLLIHLGFILFTLRLFYKLFKRQKNLDNEILILGSVLGPVILSDIFFVGYRWRYYAEPFMILAFFIFCQQVLDSINMYKNQKSSIDAGI